MISRDYSAVARRELSVAGRILYAAHVSANVVRISFGDFLQTFRLGGAGFQTRDDEELNKTTGRRDPPRRLRIAEALRRSDESFVVTRFLNSLALISTHFAQFCNW